MPAAAEGLGRSAGPVEELAQDDIRGASRDQEDVVRIADYDQCFVVHLQDKCGHISVDTSVRTCMHGFQSRRQMRP